MRHVEVFTDGACKGNPGPGGWGALLRVTRDDGETVERELCGRAVQTTNNRMEMTAVIEALKALSRPCRVDLYTDSKYVIDGITTWVHSWQRKGWKTAAKKAVLNEDLWRALIEAEASHEIAWHWVKGHAGHPENERVDAIASEQALLAGGARD